MEEGALVWTTGGNGEQVVGLPQGLQYQDRLGRGDGVLKNAVFPTLLAWEIGEAEDSHLELFCISLATWLAS